MTGTNSAYTGCLLTFITNRDLEYLRFLRLSAYILPRIAPPVGTPTPEVTRA